MNRIQKAYSVILTFWLMTSILLLPETFFFDKNLYMQIPLYRYLEEKEYLELHREDEETLNKVMQANMEYAGKEAEKNGTVKEKAERDKKDEKKDEKKDGEKDEESAPAATNASVILQPRIDLSPVRLSDSDYLLNQFFIVDEETSVQGVTLQADSFLSRDLSISKNPTVPQILIYHSHSQETFSDSRPGHSEDTVVGVGAYLKAILEEQYGYQVMHITDAFDMMSGTLDRSSAYDYAGEAIQKILKENPTLEVVIDLHRDGISENRHLVTEINGKQMAQLMFFNGISYTKKQGKVSYLPNPYIQENLSFSFQLEYQCALYYPELYRGIYLAGLRYNLHLKPRALLLEAGAQTNTVEEVKNAMEPFAFLLDRVLSGKPDGAEE